MPSGDLPDECGDIIEELSSPLDDERQGLGTPGMLRTMDEEQALSLYNWTSRGKGVQFSREVDFSRVPRISTSALTREGLNQLLAAIDAKLVERGL